jgi:hypothetical protein
MAEINAKHTYRLWNPKSFIIFSALFSFLPAGIMYALNYGRIGNQRKKWLFLMSTIIGFIALSAFAFIMPTTISKFLCLGINIGIGVYFMNTQTAMYQAHIQNGGERASYLLPITIAILIFVLLIATIMYSQYIPDKKLNYNKNQLYYTDSVTELQAKKLGDFLKTEGFFKDDSQTNVKIDKQDNVFIFSMIIKDEYINNEEVVNNMKLVSKELALNVFENNKVNINLCNSRFKVLESINAD